MKRYRTSGGSGLIESAHGSLILHYDHEDKMLAANKVILSERKGRIEAEFHVYDLEAEIMERGLEISRLKSDLRTKHNLRVEIENAMGINYKADDLELALAKIKEWKEAEKMAESDLDNECHLRHLASEEAQDNLDRAIDAEAKLAKIKALFDEPITSERRGLATFCRQAHRIIDGVAEALDGDLDVDVVEGKVLQSGFSNRQHIDAPCRLPIGARVKLAILEVSE